MAQDPEPDDERIDEDEIDSSHDMDMVSLYDSQTIEAEMEASVIRSMLDVNGIPSILSATPYPPLGYMIRVPRKLAEAARRLIEEQQAAGPEAAAEAEAAGEEHP